MRLWHYLLVIGALLIVGSGQWENIVGAASAPPPSMGFFVTSAKSKTGNLGGLAGADKTCQSLATAVGQGDKTWRAYLSAEHDPSNNNNPTNARDRIGNGPWFNANGIMVGNDLADLHARRGNPILLVDEHGQMIPGNWPNSPKPTEHDILTGSTAEGHSHRWQDLRQLDVGFSRPEGANRPFGRHWAWWQYGGTDCVVELRT